MITDARRGGGGEALQFDVAIVGAGMAGITLAERLRGAGRTIGLLEGGGLEPERSAQSLLAGENGGHPYFSLDGCRLRVFGGSTLRWGGWCRPLDEPDLEPRGWIPHSGWPLRWSQLAPYYGQAAVVARLADPSFDPVSFAGRIASPPGYGAPEYEPALIQARAKPDFGERYRAVFERAADVTVLLHADVTELATGPQASRIDHLRIARPGAEPLLVRARTYVLAAGGIENARLLLASPGASGRGVGNESDWVGRCFMDHLHLPAGHLVLARGATLSPFFARTTISGALVQGVLTPTAQALAARRLPACAIAVESAAHDVGPAPMLGWPQGLVAPAAAIDRRVRRRFPVAARAARRTALGPIEAVRRRRSGRRAARVATDENLAGEGLYTLYARAEQTPNRDSRITLDRARDRLGMPRVRLDWAFRASDLDALESWMKVLDTAMRGSDQGRCVVRREEWAQAVTGGPHHMGTTRMSTDPRDGVVDGDCRVHTVENLYVAGSSVFATGGHANPSLTILALALRLADHLRAG